MSVFHSDNIILSLCRNYSNASESISEADDKDNEDEGKKKKAEKKPKKVVKKKKEKNTERGRTFLSSLSLRLKASNRCW